MKIKSKLVLLAAAVFIFALCGEKTFAKDKCIISEQEMEYCQAMSDNLLAFLDNYINGAYSNDLNAALNDGANMSNAYVNSEDYKSIIDSLKQKYDYSQLINVTDELSWILGWGEGYIYMDVYSGTREHGWFIASKSGGGAQNTIEIMEYYNGRANGTSVRYVFCNDSNAMDYVRTGAVVDGVGQGVAEYIFKDGQKSRVDINEENISDWSWWPEWPENDIANIHASKTSVKIIKFNSSTDELVVKIRIKKLHNKGVKYVVYVGTDKSSLTKMKTTAKTKTAFTVKNVEKDKKYYIAVKPVKTINGKQYYGKMSKAVEIKM